MRLRAGQGMGRPTRNPRHSHIACGSGLYSLTLAAQHPVARATLLDWANVLEHTKANVDRLGLHERTNFIDGDVFEVDLGEP